MQKEGCRKRRWWGRGVEGKLTCRCVVGSGVVAGKAERHETCTLQARKEPVCEADPDPESR